MKMKEVSLLDCTLRDGGYVNDWEFGHDNLVCIFERLVSAGTEFIELGFIDERRTFDYNRSIAPDTQSFQKIFGGLDQKDARLVGMIDFGTCSIGQIQPCADSIFDGIRVIFKKHARKEAMEFCRQLKELGYLVFVQLVSITSYQDDELNDLMQLANNLRPYAVSMVDTYGLLQQENLLHYFTQLDRGLHPDITLGYHSHNNFQRAFANCTELLSQETERRLLADTAIYGMGKSAGNCPAELLAMYLNDHFHKHYDITQILEALDVNIMGFYRKKPWGYSMFYYIAALHRCHPDYAAYLMEQRTLSVRQVHEILSRLEQYGDKQLLYDQTLIEQLYLEYQSQICIDDKLEIQRLAQVFSGRKMLLLGPGKSIAVQKEKICRFIRQNAPFIITVNYLPDGLPADCLFLSNAKRYVQLASALLRRKDSLRMIATSNVAAIGGQEFDYTLDVSSLLDQNAEVIDNSFLMLLKVMLKTGVSQVTLGGFDGYLGDSSKDYIKEEMEYEFSREKAERMNAYVKTEIEKLKQQIGITFLTDSLYL